ncbi:MAG: MEDS domain-containing protein, partial [Nitrososphaerota archaeon]|nr:MEDS domain-containing protein [Nitrososphaerota archaeon]
ARSILPQGGQVRMRFPEVAEHLVSVMPGSHNVLIYDSRESKREVLFNHLKVGEPDSKLVYVCSEERPETIREAMGMQGIDVERLERERRLDVPGYEEVYIAKDGTVDVKKIVDGFAYQAFDSKRHGLKGIRAAAEMSCFFKRGKVVELIEYERALGTRFHFPGAGLCAYNVLEMQAAGCLDTLMPLLRAHGSVILTGPRGAVVLQADRAQQRDVERTLDIKIPFR